MNLQILASINNFKRIYLGRYTTMSTVRRRRTRRQRALKSPTTRYAQRRVARRTRGTRGLSTAELQALQDVYGGNFFRRLWRGVKSVAKPVGKFIKDNKLVSKGLQLIPHPTAQKAAAAARAVGLGTRGGRRPARRATTQRRKAVIYM